MPKWEEISAMAEVFVTSRKICEQAPLDALTVHILVAPNEYQRWSCKDEGVRWTDGPLASAFVANLCAKSGGAIGRDLVTRKQYSCMECFNNVD
jgi:hypothetical protein